MVSESGNRQHFHQELNQLYQRLLEIGALAEDSIRRGVEALSEQDPQKARAVVEQDDRVDEMEAAIEEECVRLLALQQPMAVDLRLLATIMKVVTDLERLGDYAVNIAQTAVAMAQEPLVKPLVDIPRMARLAMGMVRESLEALIARDAQGAYAVCTQDDEMDALFERLHDELIGVAADRGNPGDIVQCCRLLSVAGCLERIADHATNIAERTIYLVEGRRYKTRSGRWKEDSGMSAP